MDHTLVSPLRPTSSLSRMASRTCPMPLVCRSASGGLGLVSVLGSGVAVVLYFCLRTKSTVASSVLVGVVQSVTSRLNLVFLREYHYGTERNAIPTLVAYIGCGGRGVLICGVSILVDCAYPCCCW